MKSPIELEIFNSYVQVFYHNFYFIPMHNSKMEEEEPQSGLFTYSKDVSSGKVGGGGPQVVYKRTEKLSHTKICGSKMETLVGRGAVIWKSADNSATRS